MTGSSLFSIAKAVRSLPKLSSTGVLDFLFDFDSLEENGLFFFGLASSSGSSDIGDDIETSIISSLSSEEINLN